MLATGLIARAPDHSGVFFCVVMLFVCAGAAKERALVSALLREVARGCARGARGARVREVRGCTRDARGARVRGVRGVREGARGCTGYAGG